MDFLEQLFRKETPEYRSVLESRNMADPRYRAYLEQQQGLKGVYPELAMLGMRGLKPGPVAPVQAPQIGSKVPAGYIPFTELHPSVQRLAMLRQKSIGRNEGLDLENILQQLLTTQRSEAAGLAMPVLQYLNEK